MVITYSFLLFLFLSEREAPVQRDCAEPVQPGVAGQPPDQHPRHRAHQGTEPLRQGALRHLPVPFRHCKQVNICIFI